MVLCVRIYLCVNIKWIKQIGKILCIFTDLVQFINYKKFQRIKNVYLLWKRLNRQYFSMFILNIQILNNKFFWFYMYDSIYSWLTLKKCLTARLILDFDDLPREASNLILNIVWIYEILSIWIRWLRSKHKKIIRL